MKLSFCFSQHIPVVFCKGLLRLVFYIMLYKSKWIKISMRLMFKVVSYSSHTEPSSSLIKINFQFWWDFVRFLRYTNRIFVLISLLKREVIIVVKFKKLHFCCFNTKGFYGAFCTQTQTGPCERSRNSSRLFHVW